MNIDSDKLKHLIDGMVDDPLGNESDLRACIYEGNDKNGKKYQLSINVIIDERDFAEKKEIYNCIN